ncbi:MAG: NAD(P)/FAD-dependent oxidoreductase [Phycisphaerae bacterium]
MTDLNADIAIIGSGFGGSLTALLAKRIGMAPVLIERGEHPRFAIGESSTPIADLVLRELCDRYGLDKIAPLCGYGSWKRVYPEITCGLKRGFSYFRHGSGGSARSGEPDGHRGSLRPRGDRANELLVAASPDNEHSDTQWYRADVDAFFVKQVQEAGIPYFDRTELTSIEPGDVWRLSGRREAKKSASQEPLPFGRGTDVAELDVGFGTHSESITVRAGFVVDASGEPGALRSALGIDDDPVAAGMKTNSRTIYSHFDGVRPWHDIYVSLGGDPGEHPFGCDDAALHQVIDGGWMWQLRFDNGVTSAGFVLDCDRYPHNADISPGDEWASLLARYPSIAAQFDSARAVMPLVRSGRLQRCATRMAGDNWAMLPYTACFVDPLHSAGNAFTLTGIERLIAILDENRDAADRARRLADYDRAIKREAGLVDTLIHGCYLGFDRFELMIAYSMLYFAAATFSEHRRRAGEHRLEDGFLCGGDAAFRQIVERAYEMIATCSGDEPHNDDTAAFTARMAELIAPYNVAGLCDAGKRNMYPFM